MLNNEFVELALKNKDYHLKLFKGQCPDEIIEDIFQNLVLDVMTKVYEHLDIKTYKKYFNVAMRNSIWQYKNKHKHFFSPEINENGENLNLFDTIADENCEYEKIEIYQNTQFNLKDMKNHISNLHPKQKEAIQNYLNGTGLTTTPNFKQAMRNLRNTMGGKIFKTDPDKYKPKSNKVGCEGSLSSEAVLDIRANIKRGKNGDLIGKGYFAQKYKVSKKVIYLVAKGVNYKDIK